eukprot:scaffold12204_cov61-Phaeocystis_antarctica.AAC.11
MARAGGAAQPKLRSRCSGCHHDVRWTSAAEVSCVTAPSPSIAARRAAATAARLAGGGGSVAVVMRVPLPKCSAGRPTRARSSREMDTGAGAGASGGGGWRCGWRSGAGAGAGTGTGFELGFPRLAQQAERLGKERLVPRARHRLGLEQLQLVAAARPLHHHAHPAPPVITLAQSGSGRWRGRVAAHRRFARLTRLTRLARLAALCRASSLDGAGGDASALARAVVMRRWRRRARGVAGRDVGEQ